MEEFFRQGDLEKERHMTVSALCNRCTTAIPKSQSCKQKLTQLLFKIYFCLFRFFQNGGFTNVPNLGQVCAQHAV